MMRLENLHTVYFIGIGGIGMSALARYFNTHGKTVVGYDRTATPLTNALEAEGIVVHYEDTIEAIPHALSDALQREHVLVIYTPAIPADHIGMNYLKGLGHELYKRSQVLGMITRETYTIAVAGTHGKTTTSSMIAHVLKHSGYRNNAFLGGISTNYNSNAILDDQAKSTVVEADEYDRSFLTLYPDIAIVTSMDADHLDIYGEHTALEDSFGEFLAQVKEEGIIIHKAGLAVKADQARLKAIASYDFENPEADYSAENVRVSNGNYWFDIRHDGTVVKDLVVGLPGRHNVENAIAAYAVAQLLGIEEQVIRAGLESFAGVKRRFEYHVKSQSLVYIDDYAHHPAELTAAINSVKELYKGRKVTGVFQPHLFTRTRDFADEFARSLELLNELILLEIYPAREEPIAGVDAQMLLDKVSLEQKSISTKKELVDDLKSRELEVLLTLGAGDIDQLVNPIREELTKRIGKQN